MKEYESLITWILGILGTLHIANWGIGKKNDNVKFKTLFDEQNDVKSRLVAMETRMETLAEIKLQNKTIATDVTEIKLAIARLPKRQDDDNDG